MVKDYKAGMSIAEILKKYNISVTAIYTTLKKFNVSNINHPKLSPQEQKGVIEDYKAGMSLAEIEKKYKVSDRTIYNTLNRHNIKSNRIKTIQ